MRKECLEMMWKIAADVDQRIVGDPLAKEWADAQSHRLWLFLELLCAHVVKRPESPLRILNAGGLGGGQFDFCLVACLRRILPLTELRWTAVEHPQSRHLQSPVFEEYVRALGIDIQLLDVASDNSTALPGINGPYDVICLTEMIEHLDYTVTVRWLMKLKEWLEKDGILIITTPNLCRLTNRWRMARGCGDLGYWGDGAREVLQGPHGHIIYWDIDRLGRILRSAGWKVVESKTFNMIPAFGTGVRRRRVVEEAANMLLRIMPRSGTHVLLVARRSIEEAKVG